MQSFVDGPDPRQPLLRRDNAIGVLSLAACATGLLLIGLPHLTAPDLSSGEANLRLAASNAADLGAALISTVGTAGVGPWIGGFNVLANLAAWISVQFSDGAGLFILRSVATVVWMIPLGLAAIGRTPLLHSWVSHVIVACIVVSLAVLFGPPCDIATISVPLALAGVLIFVDLATQPGRRREGLMITMLAIAGFSSPLACLILPAFFWRLFRRRARVDRVATLVLGAAVIAQAAAVMLPAAG